MNEQIEAYLRQHHHYGYFNKYGETVKDPYYFMYREGVDRLIELIVREAADIAKHHVMNISTYADADFVDEQIKQHFGVKE